MDIEFDINGIHGNFLSKILNLFKNKKKKNIRKDAVFFDSTILLKQRYYIRPI